MKEKSRFYRLVWAVVFIIWILLISFWHTNATVAKVFMIIYTLVIIIWSIVIIVQSYKHRKNSK